MTMFAPYAACLPGTLVYALHLIATGFALHFSAWRDLPTYTRLLCSCVAVWPAPHQPAAIPSHRFCLLTAAAHGHDTIWYVYHSWLPFTMLVTCVTR